MTTETIIENMYLCLSTAAYNTVPVRDLGNGPETLADIFPNAPKYATSDRVLCGIEVTSGGQIPMVIATTQSMGLSVAWGDTVGDDVNILFHADALIKQAELEAIENQIQGA